MWIDIIDTQVLVEDLLGQLQTKGKPYLDRSRDKIRSLKARLARDGKCGWISDGCYNEGDDNIAKSMMLISFSYKSYIRH